MPAMIREKGKPKRIAYKVLGVPENLKKQKLTQKQLLIRRRLLFEETQRVR